MTVVVSFAGTNDGRINNLGLDYAQACAGTNDPLVSTTTEGHGWGQTRGDGYYTIEQGFEEFPYVLDGGALIASAHFEFVADGRTGIDPPRDMEIRAYDWGGTLQASDWRTPSQLSGLTRLGRVQSASNAGFNVKLKAGSPELLARLQTSGAVRVVVTDHRTVTAIPPVGDEMAFFISADISGTSRDPALVYTTTPISTLNRVLGAQVQLSDGTHAFLESTAHATAPTVTLKHRADDGTVSTVATVPTGSGAAQFHVGAPSGMQSLALTRDATDNLYVVGRRGSSITGVLAAGYAKGTGHGWTARTPLAGSLAVDSVSASGWAGVWHAEGGTAGTALGLHTTPAGESAVSGVGYVLLSCDALLAGSGTLLRGSGTGSALLTEPSTTNLGLRQNPSLTGTDLAATSGRGFVLSYNGAGQVSTSRYALSTGGDSISSVTKSTDPETVVIDANSKARVLAIDSTTWAFVVKDHVEIRQNISGTTTTTIGAADLASESITSFPTELALSATAAWDCVYDSAGETIWFYYFDQADARRLMRTGFSLGTNFANQTETEVAPAVGAVGSTNHAIRVHRGALVGDQVLIAVANETSGGTHSTLYEVDQFNEPPTAPTLTTINNFDAENEQAFTWTFNDPNPNDTQSAYQLQINTDAGVSEVDTTKVTSGTTSYTLTAGTLSNPESWQWRVKTWDQQDEESAWSNFQLFLTAEGGSVEIIAPAEDNPEPNNLADWLIEWEVTGTTQDSYRVEVVNNTTGAVDSDTGWVSSVDTMHTVTLPTDVEWRIEVTVRNNGVESNSGTRLITPLYGSPMQPLITTEVTDEDAYILINIENPDSTGDEPQVISNEVWRRRTGSSDAFELVGSTVENSSFRDYTAASGVSYDYFVRGLDT